MMDYDLGDEKFLKYCEDNSFRREYTYAIPLPDENSFSFSNLQKLVKSVVGDDIVNDIVVNLEWYYSDVTVIGTAYVSMSDVKWYTFMWGLYRKAKDSAKKRALRKAQKEEAEYVARIHKMNYEKSMESEYGPKTN